MLQTAIEGVDGSVSWRDVSCEDADDFEALWQRPWLLADAVKKDEMLCLPCEKPKDWGRPASMVESWRQGVKDGNRVLFCDVQDQTAAREASVEAEGAARDSEDHGSR